MSSTNMHAKSVRIACAVHRGNPKEEADARRDLSEAKIAAAIERALSTSPELTPAQIKRLSALLRGAK